MRPAACLQRNQAAWVSLEEVEQLAARELSAKHRSPSAIRTVRMENVLCDIQPDRGNL
jgi:hypothetical protein